MFMVVQVTVTAVARRVNRGSVTQISERTPGHKAGEEDTGRLYACRTRDTSFIFVVPSCGTRGRNRILPEEKGCSLGPIRPRSRWYRIREARRNKSLATTGGGGETVEETSYPTAGIGLCEFRDSEATFYELFLRVPEKKVGSLANWRLIPRRSVSMFRCYFENKMINMKFEASRFFDEFRRSLSGLMKQSMSNSNFM